MTVHDIPTGTFKFSSSDASFQFSGYLILAADESLFLPTSISQYWLFHWFTKCKLLPHA